MRKRFPYSAYLALHSSRGNALKAEREDSMKTTLFTFNFVFFIQRIYLKYSVYLTLGDLSLGVGTTQGQYVIQLKPLFNRENWLDG